MKGMADITYLSREDSELLRKALASVSGKDFLEIGIGYGSNLRSVLGNFDLVVGTDIKRTEAFATACSSKAELLVADRATCFRPSVFDVVAMNPPYLSSGKIEDQTTDAGEGGFEIPRLFLDEALRVAKPGGRVFVLLSSETNLRLLEEYCRQGSVKCSTLLEKHLFFESLFIFELRKEQERA